MGSVFHNKPHAPSLHVFHFARIWMLGNLPEVEISEQNKATTNTITTAVDNKGFSFHFPPRKRHHSQRAYLIENEKKKSSQIIIKSLLI